MAVHGAPSSPSMTAHALAAISCADSISCPLAVHPFSQSAWSVNPSASNAARIVSVSVSGGLMRTPTKADVQPRADMRVR